MISLSVFMAEMSLLADRFNRPPSMPVLERYYEILKKELDEAQFLAASMQSFTDDNQFPSPRRLIELGKNGPMTIEHQIGCLMSELNLTAVLPDDWQIKTGCLLVKEMTSDQQAEYLSYLQKISNRMIGAAHEN